MAAAGASPGRGGSRPPGSTQYPLMVTIWILCVAASGFACAVRDLPAWYQALVAVMPVAAIALLWLTNLTDPGIIPPCHEKDPVVELLEDGNDDGVPMRQIYSRDPETHVWRRKVMVDGYPALEKYCGTCHLWRPPRSHHCRVCNHCMARFDHHCEVVGNCIARNNHRFFASFLMTAQIGSGLLLGGTVWRLRRIEFPNKGNWSDPETYILLFLATLYAYHVLMLVFGTIHCVGVVFDVTTKDLMAGHTLCDDPPCLPGRRNPARILSAWLTIWCSPVEFLPSSGSSCRVSPAPSDGGGNDSNKHIIVPAYELSKQEQQQLGLVASDDLGGNGKQQLQDHRQGSLQQGQRQEGISEMVLLVRTSKSGHT